jgi:hypothetical protein
VVFISSLFVYIFWVGFYLLGFAYNTTKEYGPMRNPEVQDETSMYLLLAYGSCSFCRSSSTVPLCVLIFLYSSVSDNTGTKRVMTGEAEDLEVKVPQNSL